MPSKSKPCEGTRKYLEYIIYLGKSEPGIREYLEYIIYLGKRTRYKENS